MIIKQTIVVRNLTADYPFSGDPAKEWYCEVKDSNLNNEANPKVTGVRQGYITLECLPRHLNAEMIVWFHTPDDVQEVKQLEKASIVADALPKVFTNIAFYTVKYLKTTLKWILRFAVISVILAAVLYFVPTDKGIVRKGIERWEKFNVARSALTIKNEVNTTVDDIRDNAFFDSAGIKRLELEHKMSYRGLFKRQDDKLYIMKDLVIDDDKNVLIVEQDDADDYCDEMGGFLMNIDILKDVILYHRRMGVSKYSDYPEWSSTPFGMFSDDYAMLKKSGALPESADRDPNDPEIYWGDDGDVKAGFRCAILRTNFVEEHD